jgi:hypothetical protein
MNTLEKMLGAKGVFYAAGGSANPMPEGKQCFALMIAADDTEVTEMEQITTPEGTPATIDDLSWQGVALKRGDYIPLEYPIISITLTNANDVALCYLEDSLYVEPEE